MAPTAGPISFSRSRPSEILFPLDEFRATCREVIDERDAASILQLGPPAAMRRCGVICWNRREPRRGSRADDILITSGCQQAFDLIQRALGQGTVLMEDPVYPGVATYLSARARE